jgi:ribosomal protein S18 acetylase RimI-like enzyme
MMREADQRPEGGTPGPAVMPPAVMPPAVMPPAVMPPEGLVLRGAQVNGRVRCWPSEPNVAQLVMYQQSRPPSHDDLTRWCAELAQRGFTAVRTSALATAASARVESHGFKVIQELVLLQHDEPAHVPSPTVRTTRLLVGNDAAAAAVDRIAFGPRWSLDATAVHDVRTATPRHRARAVLGPADDANAIPGDVVTAYAITGRDSRLGFLQRLAVHPERRREGLGLALVHDSLRWLARWRVQRVLVNTPTTNDAALALYEGAGFHRLPDGLRVYEKVLR